MLYHYCIKLLCKAISSEGITNEVRHAPRRFISDAQLSLELLGGDSAAGASHEVHGIEPHVQGRRGFVEDGSRRRVQVVPTSYAGPTPAGLRGRVAPKSPLALALRARGMFSIWRVAVSPKPP